MPRKSLLAVLVVTTAAQFGLAQEHRWNWGDYGGGPDSSKFVALDEINKSNVSQLQIAWIYPTGDNRTYLFSPVVVDNVVYVQAKNSSLVALDATTGKEIWIHENLPGMTTRGMNYWESKDRKDRRLIFSMNSFLQEIDARTGKSIASFGDNGLVNLRVGLDRDVKTVRSGMSNTPGKVFENLIIVGSAPGEAYMSPPGNIRAYDVLTGRLAWNFHTVPRPGEVGYDTWPKDAWKYAGGVNNWGEFSIDVGRGIVYVPTGSSTYDFYGADRKGANVFANCLLALDARTGKRLWHFQTVHHDLWDYDNVSAPQLITVNHDGKSVDAVAMATKAGLLWVFDRVTGQPLWPIEERPVPKSDVPGEEAYPTQPFPTAPPPFARLTFSEEDLNPFYLSAEERSALKVKIANARNDGMFTPPSLNKDTIQMPGLRGGNNWGATAANPAAGMVYVLTQDWPTISNLTLEDPYGPRAASQRSRAAGQVGRAAYEESCQACHGVNGSGSAMAPVPLARIDGRLDAKEFTHVITNGRGEMGAITNLDAKTISAVYAFLTDPTGSGRTATAVHHPARTEGPVVSSGGAPGGLEPQPVTAQYTQMAGPPYPEGVDAPRVRYYTSYGMEYSFIINPPWSSLVAYDLNKGTIKWKVPHGEDAQATAEGGKDTGVFRGGERHGMVVTSAGLIFTASLDGKARVYDADTGRVLWTATLPAGSEGVPAMYQANGRQYFLVPASSPITSGRLMPGAAAPDPLPGRGYVAFALPERPGRRQQD